ncbi:hypothetical protein [Spirosoma sp. KNUC1025]|uniref:hypothetical protein n=1 Tax=Spirosoma sp. KNUC1025 TaxID=2894082 RepID=UPI0038708000|nr:hypothetical protein LN737_05695 [Spirosoma sp. KNUC1025]
MKFFRSFAMALTLMRLSILVGLAQRSEIWREKPGTWLLNAGVGMTRYVGDLNERTDLAHLRLGTAINAAVSYRYSPQLSFRAEAQLYYIRGSQANTHLAYNNLSFRSLNPDIWAGLQWDFWRAEDRNHIVIPYALAGIGLTYLTPKTTYKNSTVSLALLHTESVAYNRLPLIVRYGLGVPVTATERFKFHLEGTYTHVFSDYVDDVSTVYPDRSHMEPLAAALSDRRAELGQSLNPPGAKRGNSGKRDGYFVLSARLVFIISTPSQRNYRRTFGG